MRNRRKNCWEMSRSHRLQVEFRARFRWSYRMDGISSGRKIISKGSIRTFFGILLGCLILRFIIVGLCYSCYWLLYFSHLICFIYLSMCYLLYGMLISFLYFIIHRYDVLIGLDFHLLCMICDPLECYGFGIRFSNWFKQSF